MAVRWLRSIIVPLVVPLLVLLLVATATGCLVVPRTRQRHLEDPTMRAQDSRLDAHARRKLHTAREGAGGGDGEPAGGGCGCSN